MVGTTRKRTSDEKIIPRKVSGRNNRDNKFEDPGNRGNSVHSTTYDMMPSGHRAMNRRKVIDTSQLARGLTARFIGIRVANHIKSLAASEIERDIRHMEGYSAACVSYSQQLFAFSNRELVTRGHYGAAPPAPGMTFTQPAQNEYGLPNVTMPVKIDPEEEKRLAALRKRVAASEAKREVLETEYVSLRAHYVHESHKLNRSRKAVSGQFELLTELVKRRGKVLALRRVRLAVARDIAACLEARAAVSAKSESNGDHVDTLSMPTQSDSHMTDVERVENTEVTNEIPLDLIDVWSTIEAKLQEAELSCTDIDTPENLKYIKKALYKDSLAMDNTFETNGGNNGSRRSKSPMRINDTEDDMVQSKKKSRGDRASSMRNSDDASLGTNAMEKYDSDDSVIPWNCRVMPRTPYDLALYLSNLSSAPDMAAAFACDGLFGSKSESLSWLESNLPSQAALGAQNERDKLEEMKKELELLQSEMKAEIGLNSEIQNEIIEGKKRNDELTAMMIMIRSETEAVIQR